jgi:hypothetical protein
VHVGPVPKLFLLGLRSKERCPNHAVILPPCHVKDPIFRFLLAEHAARWSSAVTAFFDLCLCPPAVLPCRFLGPCSVPAIFRSCRRFLFAQHYFSVRIFLLRQGFVLVTVFFSRSSSGPRGQGSLFLAPIFGCRSIPAHSLRVPGCGAVSSSLLFPLPCASEHRRRFCSCISSTKDFCFPTQRFSFPR